jgi:hypothetical protein
MIQFVKTRSWALAEYEQEDKATGDEEHSYGKEARTPFAEEKTRSRHPRSLRSAPAIRKEIVLCRRDLRDTCGIAFTPPEWLAREEYPWAGEPESEPPGAPR